MTYEEVLTHFTVKSRHGNSAKCLCPCHADKEPSLSIKAGEKKTVIQCHAGCAYADIVAAAGLKTDDLYYEPLPAKASFTDAQKRQYALEVNSIRYDYVRMDDGKYDCTKFRNKNKKGFTMGHYEGQTLVLNAKQSPTAVYAPCGVGSLKAAIQKGELICYTEGEKDSESLWRNGGYLSFTAGAARTFKDALLPYLKGGRFIVFADNDDVGKVDAERITTLLNTVGSAACIVPPDVEEHGDISDWLANHTSQELEELIQNAVTSKTVPCDNPPAPSESREQNEPLDLRQFHQYLENGRVRCPFDFRVCEYIKAHYHLFVLGSTPYIYEGGVYSPDWGGTKLKSIVKGLLFDQFKKTKFINPIFNLLIEDYELKKDFGELNEEIIGDTSSWSNFKDCFVNLETLECVKHSPEHMSLNQIPWTWAECQNAPRGEQTDKFLTQAIPDADDRRMLLEYVGQCTAPYRKFQRFLDISGEAGSGKGTTLRLVQNVVGDRNCASVSLQKFSERFSTSQLVGKLLNVCGDLAADAISDPSIIKQATGEDTISVERKGENGFNYKNYAHLMFAANSLPTVLNEKSNGFYRRLMVLKMNNVVPESEQDVDLDAKLEKEIPYFIRICVEAAHEAFKRGRLFESPNSKREVAQVRADNDITQAWLLDCCEFKKDGRADRAEAFENFEEYCEKNKRQSLTKHIFFKNLRNRFGCEVRGKTEYWFRGFVLKNDDNFTAKFNNETNGEWVQLTEEDLKVVPFNKT